MDKNWVLEIKNVSKEYIVGQTKIQALDDVSIQIAKGEFLAITGRSGSGKSTLMHLIGLLDTPSTGDIYLSGVKASSLQEKQLARLRNKEIGFVFQSFNLLPRVSALENVMLPFQYSDVPLKQWKQKGMEMLSLVELSDRVNNKSNELSGGQKQRVAIARALVNDPAIILADEPTGNLDSKTSTEIENLFHKLNDQGKTIIIVTHDDELAKIAKRKITLLDGKVIDDTSR